MNKIVGSLDWMACYSCKNHRKTGGCDILDKQGCEILSIDIDYDIVECEDYEPQEE